MKNKKIKNLGILFEKLANKNNNIFLKFDKKNYSYSELDDISNKFLTFFNKINIVEKDIVAIESEKNIFTFALIIACLKKGVTYSFFDGSDSSERTNLILSQLKPKKIFTFNENNSIKNSFFLTKKELKKILNYNKSKKKLVNKSYIAYIMFTSGSTGAPKGAKISHNSLTYFIEWIKKTFKVNQNTVMSNLNPLHFDNSVFDIYGSIFNKAKLIPINKFELLNGKKLIKKLNKLKCDLWFSVPSLLNLIITTNNIKIFKNTKLKKIIFGGERFPVKSMRSIYRFLKHPEIYNVSGPTECTCMCSAHKVSKKELYNSEDIYIGRINSYFNYRISKINKQDKYGELFLEGPAVGDGYINNKSLTMKSFYKNKGHKGYKTGDIVKENKNRNLKILGRVDNQIKFLGHRIELEEIEKKINKVFNLSDCLVSLKQKEVYPYSKLVLITDNRSLNHNTFYTKLKKKLPNYMIPEEIVFTKKFKYNRNNKIDRNFFNL